jgi:alkanesulfonate monooxygenase SsuD/methylene tetrahydromethanopterin reductase-like flavin-dependent oxidoreductase (luciferase family)
MEVWHFTEMPYPDVPANGPRAVTLGSEMFDPEIGRQLYQRYFDEYMLADELGFNVMLNEHHATAGCINVAGPLSCAILARQTKNARILLLGNPIANRSDPLRVAEEMAMIDCISGGRLEVGFVRGVTNELFPSNTNPSLTYERLWDGIDLVLKAWTTHDGPFNYEGRFWHYRNANVWPRTYQQPHPPVWITGGANVENVKEVARRGYKFASFLQPFEAVKKLFDAYREACAEEGLPEPGPDRFAYMPFVFTAETEKEAMEGAEHLMWYIGGKSEPQFSNPTGYSTIQAVVAGLRGQSASRTAFLRQGGAPLMREKGALIVGTPDSVYSQVVEFAEKVGGLGNLLVMQQGGGMPHEDTKRSMTLFGREVLPRLKKLYTGKQARAAE